MKPYREKLDINTLFKYRDAVLLHAHMMDATQKNRIEKFYSRVARALGCKDYYQWFSNSFFTINDARALSRALKPLIPSVTIETVRDLKEIILKTAREKRKTPRIQGIVQLRYKHKKLNDEYSERACYYRRIFPLKMEHYWKTSEASKMDFKNVIELLLTKHNISTHERKN
jgi:hypothetical protein